MSTIDSAAVSVSQFADHPVGSTHDLQPDPTHDLSSVYRETCTRCGRSALIYRLNEYGSALEKGCDGN